MQSLSLPLHSNICVVLYTDESAGLGHIQSHSTWKYTWTKCAEIEMFCCEAETEVSLLSFQRVNEVCEHIRFKEWMRQPFGTEATREMCSRL
jgi:hypothetical protein